MSLRIQQNHLPSWCYADRSMQSIDGIIAHYFSARWVNPSAPFSLPAVRRLLLDLNREAAERRWYDIDSDDRLYASYHYLIGRRGAIHELVPLPRVAYHAGESEMHGREGCNEFTAGVTCIGTHNSGFTPSQYEAFGLLAAWLARENDIATKWIGGHEDVAIPRGRKRDPGPRWEWNRALKQLTF